MTKHSPLPWKLWGAVHPTSIADVAGIDVARAVGIDTTVQQDIALIVRAVNAHEELAAALEAFLAWLDNDERYSPGPSLEDVAKLARAALAKARGERA